jgi:hypothetical protein
LIFIKVWWGEIFIEFMIKLLIFIKVMKVMISKIIYDDNIFDKTFDFMKVWWGEIFIEFIIYDKTIDFYKSLVK